MQALCAVSDLLRLGEAAGRAGRHAARRFPRWGLAALVLSVLALAGGIATAPARASSSAQQIDAYLATRARHWPPRARPSAPPASGTASTRAFWSRSPAPSRASGGSSSARAPRRPPTTPSTGLTRGRAPPARSPAGTGRSAPSPRPERTSLLRRRPLLGCRHRADPLPVEHRGVDQPATTAPSSGTAPSTPSLPVWGPCTL